MDAILCPKCNRSNVTFQFRQPGPGWTINCGSCGRKSLWSPTPEQLDAIGFVDVSRILPR